MEQFAIFQYLTPQYERQCRWAHKTPILINFANICGSNKLIKRTFADNGSVSMPQDMKPIIGGSLYRRWVIFDEAFTLPVVIMLLKVT